MFSGNLYNVRNILLPLLILVSGAFQISLCVASYVSESSAYKLLARNVASSGPLGTHNKDGRKQISAHIYLVHDLFCSLFECGKLHMTRVIKKIFFLSVPPF